MPDADPRGGHAAEVAVSRTVARQLTVAGSETFGVRLTQAAYAHGSALALPEKVAMARPTVFERADAMRIRIPIEMLTESVSA
jgi:hypothetical protein